MLYMPFCLGIDESYVGNNKITLSGSRRGVHGLEKMNRLSSFYSPDMGSVCFKGISCDFIGSLINYNRFGCMTSCCFSAYKLAEVSARRTTLSMGLRTCIEIQ